MKVKELIDGLKDIDGNAEVYLSVDAEGNGFNMAAEIDDTSFFFDGDVYDTTWTADEAGLEKAYWEDLKENRKPAIVLWP